MDSIDAEAKFTKCFDEFMKIADCYYFYSNTAPMRATEEYKAIVRLGKPALPYLMQKLREGHFLLNGAVSQITRINIVKLNRTPLPCSEQEKSKLWIRWWETNKGGYG